MGKRNNILVPDARDGMNQLMAKVTEVPSPDQAKFEVAKELGINLIKGYNGQLTSYQAGKVGGQLGGRMVKELVQMAQQNLVKR